MASYNIRELWKEYETVAMHFNDLLMRLRTQSLGGLAAIGTVASFLIKDNIATPDRYVYLAILVFVLLVAWIAIAVLDLTYYDRMLIGSVAAIHELETLSKTSETTDEIALSYRITEAVDGRLVSATQSAWCSGRKFYYGSVGTTLSLLLVAFVIAACRGRTA